MDETSRLVTTGAAARQLGVDPSTLTRWAAAGVVTPASRTIGGHLRWDVEVLRSQIAQQGASTSGEAGAPG